MRPQRLTDVLFAVTCCLFLFVLFVSVGCGLQRSSRQNPSENNNGTHGFFGPCDSKLSPFGGGSGTEADPYLICSVAQLSDIEIEEAGGAHFRLHTDLDLTGFDWQAIYNFTGVFDGNGYTIKHLGGFNPLVEENEGTLRNVKLVDVALTGSFNFGALASFNLASGKIENCSVVGQVTSTHRSGGLVGLNSGSITRSSAQVKLSGVDQMGGLAFQNTGTISQSFSLGLVATAGDTGIAGGLVGVNAGTVENSFSRAVVKGLTKVGGLVGTNGGTIRYTYSTGAVPPSGTMIGGLVGENTASGSALSSYWDIATSETSYSPVGDGKSTTAMQSLEPYTDWDFTKIWEVPQNHYPLLR